MKDFEEHVQAEDAEQAERDAEKILSGDFSLEDFVNQIKIVRKMGPLGELMEKFPLFGELPEGFSFDDNHLNRIVAIVDSMTKNERIRPDSIGDGRIQRIARGSGRDEKDVRDLLKQYNSMRAVMRQIGSAPGLLSRLPGIKQMMQLRKLKGQGMEDILGEDAGDVEAMMGGGLDPSAMAAQMAGLPKGFQPRMPAGAMARARLMGYAPEPVSTESASQRDARKKKRKKERQARKKNRKKRR
jgi:signal recognition particle subunit SRP54